MESCASPVGRRRHRSLSDSSTQTSPRKMLQVTGISPSKKLPPLNETGILGLPLISRPLDHVQWCGRFTGLNDKLKNEDPGVPQGVRITNVFRKLEALCAGEEAVKSLKRFEDKYYVSQDKLKAERQAANRHSHSSSDSSVDTISAVAVHYAQVKKFNGEKIDNKKKSFGESSIPASADPSLKETGSPQLGQHNSFFPYKPYRPGLYEFPANHDAALMEPRKGPSCGSTTPDSASSVATIIGPDRKDDSHSCLVPQGKFSSRQQIQQPAKRYQLSSSPTLKKLEHFSPHPLLQPMKIGYQLSSSPGAKQLERFSPIPTPVRENLIAEQGWRGEGLLPPKPMHDELFLPTTPPLKKATNVSGPKLPSVTETGSPHEKAQRRNVSSPLGNSGRKSSIPRPSGGGGKACVPSEVGKRNFSDPVRAKPIYPKEPKPTKASMLRALKIAAGNEKAATVRSQTQKVGGKYKKLQSRSPTPTGRLASPEILEREALAEGVTNVGNAHGLRNCGRRVSSLPRWASTNSKSSPPQPSSDTIPDVPDPEASPEDGTVESMRWHKKQEPFTPAKIQTPKRSPLADSPWSVSAPPSPERSPCRIKISKSMSTSLVKSSSKGFGMKQLESLRQSKNISTLIFSREDSAMTMGSAATGSSADVNSPVKNAEGGVMMKTGAAKVVNISREVSFGITVESEEQVLGVPRIDSETSMINSYTVLSTTTIQDEEAPSTGGGTRMKAFGGMLGAGERCFADNNEVKAVENMVRQEDKVLKEVMEELEEMALDTDERQKESRGASLRKSSGIARPGQFYQKYHQKQGESRPAGGPRWSLVGRQDRVSVGDTKAINAAGNRRVSAGLITKRDNLEGHHNDSKDTPNEAQQDSTLGPAAHRGNIQDIRSAYAKTVQSAFQVSKNKEDSLVSTNSKANVSTTSTGTPVIEANIRPSLMENVAPAPVSNGSGTRTVRELISDSHKMSLTANSRKAVIIGTNSGLPEIHIGGAEKDKVANDSENINTANDKVEENKEKAGVGEESVFSEDLVAQVEEKREEITVNNLFSAAPIDIASGTKKNGVLADITSMEVAKNARAVQGRNWLGQRKSPLNRSISPPLPASFVHQDIMKENIPPTSAAGTNENQNKTFEVTGNMGKNGRCKVALKGKKGFTGWLKGASPRLSGEIFQKSNKKGKNATATAANTATTSAEAKGPIHQSEFSREVSSLFHRLSPQISQTPEQGGGFAATAGRYYTNNPPNLDRSPSKDDREGNPIAVCMELINAASQENASPRREKLLEMSRVLVDAVSKSRDAECAAEEAKIAATKAECAAAETRKSLWVLAEIVGKGKWRAILGN